MTVVSNTTPLCYLVLIGCEAVLPKLFGSVLTTRMVMAELQHSGAPPKVQAWARNPPEWIVIHTDPPDTDESLSNLDPGESSAIRLAEQVRADVILLDELAARMIAAQRGLKIAGLLGVLRDAAQAGMLDLSLVLDSLRKTNFRASPELLRSLYFPRNA
jgi:predicted nucleic acid-binding protein